MRLHPPRRREGVFPTKRAAAIRIAAFGNVAAGALMVAAQVEIEPTRRLVERPVAGSDKRAGQIPRPTHCRQALVNPHPDARAIRVDLAATVAAAAASPVANVLGTLAFGKQKGEMLDSAVSAPLAGEQPLLYGILDQKRQPASAGGGVKAGADGAQLRFQG